MPAGSMARRVPPRPATCRARAMPPAPGPTPPATSGCSVGYGYDSPARAGYLNDLWQYSPSSGQWTWVSGERGQCHRGLRHAGYRRDQQRAGSALWRPAPGSTPPATCGCSAGMAMTRPALGRLNDLWQYSPSTGRVDLGQWRNADNADGVYGTRVRPRPAMCRSALFRQLLDRLLRQPVVVRWRTAMTRPARWAS